MATTALSPHSYNPPSPQSPYLTIKFTNANPNNPSSTNPLWPATSLQLSFRAGGKEAFMEQRLTLRDLAVDDDGAGVTVRVGERGIPRFFGAGEGEDVVVVVWAWKGERVVGSWEVGRM